MDPYVSAIWRRWPARHRWCGSRASRARPVAAAASVPCATLAPVTATSPHCDEILELLRGADCHYGNALRDEEAGLSIGAAARARDGVRLDRIVDLRSAVHQVADGEHSHTKAQAGHEDSVLRALLHFEAGMSEELRRHVRVRLAQVQSQFGLRETTQPLRCVTRGAQARRR